jgi:hypothetical protein
VRGGVVRGRLSTIELPPLGSGIHTCTRNTKHATNTRTHTRTQPTTRTSSYEGAGAAVESAQAELMVKIRERYTQVGFGPGGALLCPSWRFSTPQRVCSRPNTRIAPTKA